MKQPNVNGGLNSWARRLLLAIALVAIVAGVGAVTLSKRGTAEDQRCQSFAPSEELSPADAESGKGADMAEVYQACLAASEQDAPGPSSKEADNLTDAEVMADNPVRDDGARPLGDGVLRDQTWDLSAHFKTPSVWLLDQGETTLEVYPGTILDEDGAEHGALGVGVRDNTTKELVTGSGGRFEAPAPVKSLELIAEESLVLTLRADDGTVLLFDLNTLEWVD